MKGKEKLKAKRMVEQAPILKAKKDDSKKLTDLEKAKKEVDNYVKKEAKPKSKTKSKK